MGINEKLTQGLSGAVNPRDHNRRVALDLAGQGFVVFPVRPDKRPFSGFRWKDRASKDPARVAALWDEYPDGVPALPTGEANGFDVLDLDKGDGKDGIAALAAMGFDADTLSPLVVRTPSEGRHGYLAHLEGTGNAASHLPEGVDVRGTGGYVLAPGAWSAAGVYEASGDLAYEAMLGLPEWPKKLRPHPKSDSEPSEPGQHDLESIRDALFAIASDVGYRDWVSALMALHHETGGSRQGLAFAQAWSATYDGWTAKEVTDKWRSFGKRDGAQIGAGTLFKIARDHGWTDVTADSFEDVEDDETPDLAGLTFDAPDAWAARPPRDYVLKGLIAPGQHGCIFGEPGAGKSVIAPRLAYAVAQGEPFFGMKTKAGRVFYVACEDEEGMGARIEALRLDHGDAPDLRLVRGCSDLFSPGAVEGRGSPQFEALRRQAKRERASLIIIDTLAMSAPGLEENAAEGMGRINAISSALARYGAAVIWIHHGTKAEGNTPRGHSSFNGRLDFSLLVRKADQAGIVRASLPKNRLGPSDRQLAYRIDSRVVGTDVDGDDVTAPICIECAGTDSEPPRRYSDTQKAALAILYDLAGEREEVSEATFREALREDRRICGSDNPESRKKAVTRIIKFVASEDGISIRGGMIRLTSDGPSADDFEDCGDDD